jgi:hypothetical protein
MSFRTWFANLQVARTFDWVKQDWRRSPRSRRASQFCLPAEVLEVRSLLSSYTAASVSALVADINAANATGGANTITLAANTKFDLTAVNNTTNGANGLPVISGKNGADNLTIIGSGATIDRSTAAGTPAFRLFDVANGNSLTLQNLTLQGGLAHGSGTAADGGAIFNQGALTLSGVTVQNNVAAGMDGANYVSSTLAAATDAAGGGVWSNGTLSLQDLTLPGGGPIHTLLQNNTAQGGYGGIYYYPTPLSNNPWTAANGGNAVGGGLYVAGGTADLANAKLANNIARGGGGAGTDQAWTEWGGLGGVGSGGAVDIAGGTVAMTGLVVQSNQALGGNGGWGTYQSVLWGTWPGGSGGTGSGGGINVAGGTVTLATVDLWSNTAHGGQSGAVTGNAMGSFDGSGGNACGGGLCVGGGAVTLTHDMVTGNRAIAGLGSAEGFPPGRYYGGGIDIASAATVYVDSFTVANTINNFGFLNGSSLWLSRHISNIYGTYVLRN